MDLNLYILKSLPFSPTRIGVSAKIGPLESNLIAAIAIKITGENSRRKIIENSMSKNRLIDGYINNS